MARTASAASRKERIEQLLATHYHRRARTVARGFTVETRKRPRGWEHTLAARDPDTGRSLLPRNAVLLFDMLEAGGTKRATEAGARSVFGHTLGWYAKRLGFSMRRDCKGEPHGARAVRRLLDQLEAHNMVTRGGRAWFSAADRFPRLVLWVQPWERWTMTRFADSAGSSRSYESPSTPIVRNEEANRIAGSGCFTPTQVSDPESGAGSDLSRGSEAPAAPSIVDQRDGVAQSGDGDCHVAGAGDVLTATVEDPEASEGDRASAAPPSATFDAAATFDQLGATALRVLQGRELFALMGHVARTRGSAIDAADGRPGNRRRNSPRAHSGAPVASQMGAGVRPRPHPVVKGSPTCGPLGCAACQQWARETIAAPSVPRDRRPRAAAPIRAYAEDQAREPSTLADAIARMPLVRPVDGDGKGG